MVIKMVTEVREQGINKVRIFSKGKYNRQRKNLKKINLLLRRGSY